MTDRPEPTRETADKPEKKKPYEPPRILSREPLEAVAAGCTPSPPGKMNAAQCVEGPINS